MPHSFSGSPKCTEVRLHDCLLCRRKYARVCVRELVWACGHACVSVEQSWPRLIAASYLVVTGLIKDDKLTFGFCLSLSFSLAYSRLFYPLFWQKNRQPLVTHYGLFLEKGGG
ncbi:hypothetical protein AMECASPLE_037410 [Ameca splendens]|uniref:Uncharacterized protein n=1 Tax=Ameca splendens TaxID=208324 RepID=A0ABV0YJN6_9TELE